MCQTIMSVDELLWIINHPDVDSNLKKPFMRYFLWVYMKTVVVVVEIVVVVVVVVIVFVVVVVVVVVVVAVVSTCCGST